MKRLTWLSFLCLGALAQTDSRGVTAHLNPPLNTPDVVASELRSYLIRKAPPLPVAPNRAGWAEESQRVRKQFLDQIVFHGWPAEWVTAPPQFEDLGLIPTTGRGYRMRKLRYEIVPGFWSAAILYEPETLSGKMPAMLNVNGHVGAPGKSVEYKQKRCIQQARMGMLALNLEWLWYGELSAKENAHWNAAHLDLAGASGLGIFYLAMRKGLDYLAAHPNADPARLGVTGLSGGGWQTIILSSLDERVTLSTPVAGYSAFRARVERWRDTGDYEQNATDMLTVADYPRLTALRAPRPTLLVYNAEDDCCFRAPLVKPDIFDAVRPVFASLGAADAFEWHENTDPSDHNYQMDNRMAFYRFAARHFRLKPVEAEEPAPLLSYRESTAGLPRDNLTILGVARQLAARRAPGGDLRSILRYKPSAITRVWPLRNSKSKGLETCSYRIEFDNGLTATAVWLRALLAPRDARATLILSDKGKAGAGAEVSGRVNRGENVFAIDLFLHGDSAPRDPGPSHYAQMFTAAGERPLALQAAQLTALAGWARQTSGAKEVRVETSGVRTEMAALTAAALSPGMFTEAILSQARGSLRNLLDVPVDYTEAPEPFVLDLYKHFDIDSLSTAAKPTRVVVEPVE